MLLASCIDHVFESYSWKCRDLPGGATRFSAATGIRRHPALSRCQVLAHARIRDADRLDEISVVARPRDPLARYTAVEIPAYAVACLPNHDAPNATLHCEWCVAPCTGFTSLEEAFGFA